MNEPNSYDPQAAIIQAAAECTRKQNEALAQFCYELTKVLTDTLKEIEKQAQAAQEQKENPEA